MKFDRRRFLGFTLGAATGTAVGVPMSHILSDVVAAADEPVYPPRGIEDSVLSVCGMCRGGCGLEVRRVGERPVKLAGNRLHPVNGGRLCPKGQAGLQALFHPDRAPGPLRRVGDRGSLDAFEPATWEEALGEIAERLKRLRREGHPESLVLMHGGTESIGPRLASWFLRLFGSPNDVSFARGEEAATIAADLTQGVRQAPVYDLQSTDYILSFGGALLEAWGSPVHTMRAYGEFRQGRPGRRGKLVQVESRQSITAQSADEWIAVRPGSEGFLALGVALVLLSEGLYDVELVRARTRGFDELRSFLSNELELSDVAADTGVSVNTILRIAREFAAARRRLAVGSRRGPLLPGSLFEHLAAQVLNALGGNLDAPGGSLLPEDGPLVWRAPAAGDPAAWPEPPADPVAAAGLERPRLDGAGAGPLAADPEALAEALLGEPPYPAKVLLVTGCDPLFASFAPERMAAALDRIPLVVSFATLPDDTALNADWILPEAHFLERWDLYTTPPGLAYPLVSLAQPVTAPAGDARPMADVFLELARRVGGEVAAALPFEDSQELVRWQVNRLFEARRGAIMGTEFDEAWVRMMERAGWWTPGYRSTDELWQRMRQTGGWWDPFYDHRDWKRVLKTPSGRFELRSEELRRLAEERRRIAVEVRYAGPASPETAGSPLALLLFEPLPVAGGSGAELPFLQEILDPALEERWESWAEIHPETGSELGIGDGDRIRLTSSAGQLEVRARIAPRVVPGAVAVPVGLGKRGGGRWARNRGVHPFRVLAAAREPLSGLPDPGATRVQVTVLERAGGRSTHERRS